MAEPNMITRDKIVKATELVFVNKFNESIKKLMEALGITRKMPMTEGQLIKTYKSSVTKANGTVGEGEVIPLSKVEKTAGPTYELAYKKYRKQVTLEAIQRSGFTEAVVDTDEKLLKSVQKDIRADLMTFMGTGTASATGVGLQAALATGWGKLQVLFEDDDVDMVAFVHPEDAAAYIGKAGITVQKEFGMTYLTGFTGTTAILNSQVPKGKYYATVADNLVLAFPTVSSGEIAKAGFNFTADETGLIGIAHTPVLSNLTTETVMLTGSVLFAERLDGIVVGTITTGA